MTITIKLDGPADVVANTPALVHYIPTGRVVIHALSERRLIMSGAMDPDARGYRSFCRAASDNGATAIVAIYWDAPTTDADQLTAAARCYGLAITDILKVDGGLWSSLICQDESCHCGGIVEQPADGGLLAGGTIRAERDELDLFPAVPESAAKLTACLTAASLADNDTRDALVVRAAKGEGSAVLGEMLDLCRDGAVGPNVLSVAAAAAYLSGDGGLANVILEREADHYGRLTRLGELIDGAAARAVNPADFAQMLSAL